MEMEFGEVNFGDCVCRYSFHLEGARGKIASDG